VQSFLHSHTQYIIFSHTTVPFNSKKSVSCISSISLSISSNSFNIYSLTKKEAEEFLLHKDKHFSKLIPPTDEEWNRVEKKLDVINEKQREYFYLFRLKKH
jgi:hypothetical protein